jgi:hypothetical protein
MVRQQSGDESTVSFTRLETSRSAAAGTDLRRHGAQLGRQAGLTYQLLPSTVQMARAPIRSQKSLQVVDRYRSHANCPVKQLLQLLLSAKRRRIGAGPMIQPINHRVQARGQDAGDSIASTIHPDGGCQRHVTLRRRWRTSAVGSGTTENW